MVTVTGTPDVNEHGLGFQLRWEDTTIAIWIVFVAPKTGYRARDMRLAGGYNDVRTARRAAVRHQRGYEKLLELTPASVCCVDECPLGVHAEVSL